MTYKKQTLPPYMAKLIGPATEQPNYADKTLADNIHTAERLAAQSRAGDETSLIHLFRLCAVYAGGIQQRTQQIAIGRAIGLFPKNSFDRQAMQRITDAVYFQSYDISSLSRQAQEQSRAIDLLHHFAEENKSFVAHAALSLIYTGDWLQLKRAPIRIAYHSSEASKQGEPSSLANFFTLCSRTLNRNLATNTDPRSE